ncbi:hypothetical protein C0995_002994, partial [Termitomyces sp. Mi166
MTCCGHEETSSLGVIYAFRFPCFSASVAENSTEHTSPAEPEPAHHVKETTGSRTDITPPTCVEYAGQATREFLDILDNVAQSVPVPGFGAAVKIAINIIKACDESQAALESAKELKARIQTLVVMFVDELKGKRKEDIRAELIHDIDREIFRDMKSIATNLDKIISQHRLLLFFFRSLNESKVSECVTRLNNSMEKFSLKRTIDHTNMLTQLEQQIREFYIRQQENVELLRLGMDDVKAILNSRLPADASLPSRSPIPANSTIFHGRDSLVNDLADVITAGIESRQHIILSGPGGMGKTSTALAVMDHNKVKAKFVDDLRVWVPCVKATSFSLFLDTLHTSLAIHKKTGDTR